MIAPNGVGLSPDEKTVYVADTYLGRLWAFDIASPGVLAEPPPFQPGRVVCNLPGYQLLDSLAVEAGGKVCVATIINGGVTAFDPNGSTEHFAFPDILCTSGNGRGSTPGVVISTINAVMPLCFGTSVLVRTKHMHQSA